MDVIYTLAIVYNFININNLDDLDNNLKVKYKVEVEDKEDIGLAEAEGNIVTN